MCASERLRIYEIKTVSLLQGAIYCKPDIFTLVPLGHSLSSGAKKGCKDALKKFILISLALPLVNEHKIQLTAATSDEGAGFCVAKD